MEALIEDRALLQGNIAREDILSATKTHNLDNTTDMFRAANSCVRHTNLVRASILVAIMNKA
jgi:hypothetical protein